MTYLICHQCKLGTQKGRSGDKCQWCGSHETAESFDGTQIYGRPSLGYPLPTPQPAHLYLEGAIRTCALCRRRRHRLSAGTATVLGQPARYYVRGGGPVRLHVVYFVLIPAGYTIGKEHDRDRLADQGGEP